jgi:glucan phosphoethanolaminetransferase (alkaline phosphatase superfamily)
MEALSRICLDNLQEHFRRLEAEAAVSDFPGKSPLRNVTLAASKDANISNKIYIALLKFDFFFFLAFTVQFLVIVGSNFTDFEFYLTIVAVPVTVCFLLFAAFVTRRESYIGQAIMVVVYLAAMAYFIFKLVRMYDKGDMEKVIEYLPARKALTVFAVITILLLVATIATACVCTRNFNKGLKPQGCYTFILRRWRSAGPIKPPTRESTKSDDY